MKLKTLIFAFVIIASTIFVGCKPDTLPDAKRKFESSLAEVKKSSHIQDWYLHASNVRYDIRKSASALADYEADLYLTHYEGNYTATYTFQYKNNKWEFLKADSAKVPYDVDNDLKQLTSYMH